MVHLQLLWCHLVHPSFNVLKTLFSMTCTSLLSFLLFFEPILVLIGEAPHQSMVPYWVLLSPWLLLNGLSASILIIILPNITFFSVPSNRSCYLLRLICGHLYQVSSPSGCFNDLVSKLKLIPHPLWTWGGVVSVCWSASPMVPKAFWTKHHSYVYPYKGVSCIVSHISIYW